MKNCKTFCGKRIALCVLAKIAYKSGVSQPRRIGLLLFLVTLALYLPVARFGFCIYDDGLYVTNAPMVQKGVTWAGVKWAFTTMAAFNWHPITMLSHMVDCGLFGLNPAGPHLVNALIHAVNAALLFTLLLRLTRKLWPSAFIAALFAWHPMHVESVAWIAERKDVLSTLFALLALLAYANYALIKNEANPRAKIFYGWSLLAFALGLMSKPMVVTLPCVLLLLDFWPLGRVQNAELKIKNFRPLLFEKIPFFCIAAAVSAITFFAQARPVAGAVASLEIVPLHYRLKNIPVAYIEYLWKTFWPAKLSIFYPLPETIPPATAIAALALLVFISLAALWCHRTRPYLLTGWLWFIGMLVPVIGLVQVGSAQIADRYSYLPSVGIFLIVAFGGLELAVRWRVPRSALVVTATGILLACILTLENQLRHWQSNTSLFQHALAVTADNDVVRNNLGVALEQQGRLAEAAEQYRAAIKLEPARFQGHSNLAGTLDRLGFPAEALAEYREAVRVAPNEPSLHLNLARALHGAGQTDEALKEFAEVERLDAKNPWPHAETAKIYLQQGRGPDAIEELRTALRLDSNNVDVLTFTAQVLSADVDPAIRNGAAALELIAKANVLTGGTRPAVLDIMGMACAEMGKFNEAQIAAQQALGLANAMKLTGLEPIQHRLELYKNHQPWRESFGATNAAAVKK